MSNERKSNANCNWDINLAEGELAEELATKIFTGGITCEVKNDIDYDKYGNLALEFCRGEEDSGLTVTKADWWLHVLGINRDIGLLVRTNILQEFSRRFNGTSWCRMGGDRKRTGLIIMPAVKAFSEILITSKLMKGR